MANIFRGYLLSNAKVPLESVKTADLLPDPPTDHDYVGVLNKEYIQLDFDSEIDSQKIMNIVREFKLKCDVLTTGRGIHLYFKDDGYAVTQSTHIFNAIGIPCDVGLGNKDRVVPLRITDDVEHSIMVNGSSQTYITRKTIQREWIQKYDELDEIPAFLRPISKNDYDLAKSTTRNQTLYNYIMTLQSKGFSRDEIRKTIKIINKYVLYEPLSDREIDTITRDDAFSEELFYENGKFLHDRFANYMLANSHIVMVEELPYIYTKDQIYSADVREFERVMISKIPQLKDAQRKEVYKYIQLKASKKMEFAHPRYIGFKSTILDIETLETFPYSPKWIVGNRLPYEYNPDAYSEVMDKTLNKVAKNDPQIRALIEEMVASILYRKPLMQSCFILTGEGSNGKSTIFNILKKLIGKKNYASLDMRQLEDKYEPAELQGKLANIGDDISAKYLENSSVFKKLVTGESLLVQQKYGQPFELESYATQIFSANELPQAHDKSDGFSRRIIIVPFNAKFRKTDKDFDPHIEDKLMTDEALEYLLKLGVDGLKRVLDNKSFTHSEAGHKEKEEYMKLNNNVLDYFEEEPKIENEAVSDAYLKYTVWCANNGVHPVKKLNFGKEVKKYYDLVSKPRYINGKTIKVYEKETEE